MATLLDLPVELLLQIVSYLDLRTFLDFTSTCKALHDPKIRYDYAFWSTLIHTTFRLPTHPTLTLQTDGERWYRLLKRMHTQTRVYTWGDNSKLCLGHQCVDRPSKLHNGEELGVISDLQCGGWSTTVLTSKGALYMVGVIDGLQVIPRRQTMEQGLKLLKYPPGFATPLDRYDASTAIRQFSCGRAHILGLADSGRIWSWQNASQPAFHVKFLLYDIAENGRQKGKGVVKKVVAGWNKSCALIERTGIVLWEPLQRDQDDTGIEDAALVLESVVVPNTGFVESRLKTGEHQAAENNPGSNSIGEVRNFIMLEDFVVFCTHTGKAFVSEVIWDRRGQMAGKPVPLPVSGNIDTDESFVTDVQGSFLSFALFTRSGAVLTSQTTQLRKFTHDQLGNERFFNIIPALQHKNVIQLAFGDYHYHALHSDGQITSYGKEPQRCRALGLGDVTSYESVMRGVMGSNTGFDVELVPHAYHSGRRVWFEKEKWAWLKFLAHDRDGYDEARGRQLAATTMNSLEQAEYSEWIEQEGMDWESKFGIKGDDEDGLGCYFALSVSAAGWHSGALVLENDDLVEKLSRACEAQDLPPPTAQSHSVSILLWLLYLPLTWLSWLLGLSLYNDSYAASTSATGRDSSTSVQRGLVQRDPARLVPGASPRPGWSYKWAADHFPRLRLSNGKEMEGTVPFDEWRYGQPEWLSLFSTRNHAHPS